MKKVNNPPPILLKTHWGDPSRPPQKREEYVYPPLTTLPVSFQPSTAAIPANKKRYRKTPFNRTPLAPDL
jgi:hypothetical protein